jgi:hypothetical protein
LSDSSSERSSLSTVGDSRCRLRESNGRDLRRYPGRCTRRKSSFERGLCELPRGQRTSPLGFVPPAALATFQEYHQIRALSVRHARPGVAPGPADVSRRSGRVTEPPIRTTRREAMHGTAGSTQRFAPSAFSRPPRVRGAYARRQSRSGKEKRWSPTSRVRTAGPRLPLVTVRALLPWQYLK